MSNARALPTAAIFACRSITAHSSALISSLTASRDDLSWSETIAETRSPAGSLDKSAPDRYPGRSDDASV